MTKGKSYTSNEEFCVNDSYVVIRNSVLLAGKKKSEYGYFYYFYCGHFY